MCGVEQKTMLRAGIVHTLRLSRAQPTAHDGRAGGVEASLAFVHVHESDRNTRWTGTASCPHGGRRVEGSAVGSLLPGSSTLLVASRSGGLTPGASDRQGTLRLGGAIGRFVGQGQIRSARAEEATSLALHLDAIPQPTGLVPALAGETWRFRAWYQDANPNVTSNFTDAVEVLRR